MVPSCRRTVVTAAGVLVLLCGLSSLPRAQAESDGVTTWAAVAYSPATGKYGYGRGFYAEINAKRRALNQCGAHDARPKRAAHGACFLRSGILELGPGSL